MTTKDMGIFAHIINIIILIAITIIIVNVWIKPGKLIAYSEIGLPFIYNMDRPAPQTWSDSYDAGKNTLMFIPTTPFIKFGQLFKNFDESTRQGMMYAFILFFSGLSMYLLSNEFYNKKHKLMVVMASSLFYMLNPYMVIYAWNRLIATIFVQPLIPLVLLFYSKLLKTGKIVYSLLLSVILSLFAIYFMSITFIPFFLILMYYLYDSFIYNKWKTNFKLSIIFGVIFLITNAWYLLPLALNMDEQVTRVTAYGLQGAGLGKFKAIDYLTLIIPFPNGLSDKYYAQPYVKLANYLMILLAVLYIKKPIREIRFFWFLLIASLLISILTFSKIQFIFDSLTRTIPFFTVFANTLLSEKIGFVIVLAYAMLIPIGITHILDILPKSIKKLVLLVICISLFYVLPLPMWNGSVFGHPHVTSPYIQIPDYYNVTKQYLEYNGIGTSRIAMLPFIPYDGYSLYISGEKYAGSTLDWQIFNNPVIISLGSNSKPVNTILSKFRYNGTMAEIFSIFNVKYAVLRHDMDTLATNAENATIVKEYMDNNTKLKYAASFGALDVYEVKDTLPKIFMTDKVILIENEEEINKLLETGDFFDYMNEGFIFNNDAVALLKENNMISKIITTPKNISNTDGYYENITSFTGTYNITGKEKTDLETINLLNYSEWNLNISHINKLNDSISIDSAKRVEYIANFGNITISENSKIFIDFTLKGQTDMYIETSCDGLIEHFYSSVMSKEIIKLPANSCELNKIYFSLDGNSIFTLKRLELQLRGDSYEKIEYKNIQINNDSKLKLPEEIFDVSLQGTVSQKPAKRTDIKFSKIAPTEYKINVTNNESFILVFLETYDYDWRVYIDNKEKVYKHFAIYGYANAWLVNESLKDSVLTIKNKTQLDLERGIDISKYGTILILLLLLKRGVKP